MRSKKVLVETIAIHQIIGYLLYPSTMPQSYKKFLNDSPELKEQLKKINKDLTMLIDKNAVNNGTTVQKQKKVLSGLLARQKLYTMDTKGINRFLEGTHMSPADFVEFQKRVAAIAKASEKELAKQNNLSNQPKVVNPLASKKAALSKNKLRKTRFDNWRSDKDPTFKAAPLKIPFEKINLPDGVSESEIKAHCIAQYKQSMQMMEHSVGRVALEYTKRDPFSKNKTPFKGDFRVSKNESVQSGQKNTGVLLDYANVYSQRYMDLYEAYIQMEIDQGIPMIPVDAGQIKLHGFTSKDLLAMQDGCKVYTDLHDEIFKLLNVETESARAQILKSKNLNPNKVHDKKTENEVSLEIAAQKNAASEAIIRVMTGQSSLVTSSGGKVNLEQFLQSNDAKKVLIDELEKKAPILKQSKKNISQRLTKIYSTYDTIDPEGKALINKAHFLMHNFGHLEYQDIATQLYFLARMKPNYSASKEERILMEISHRIAGEGTIHQSSPGTLGGNPSAYLNMLKRGEPGNPEAEFREKMYFVYMNNHFANAVIKDEKTVEYINEYLKNQDKGWTLDEDFIYAMENRGKTYIPPIFRYGANAGLNEAIRKIGDHHHIEEFYKKNKNISVKDAMEGIEDMNAYYALKLSDRELMNQVGEFNWDRAKKFANISKQLNFGTGASLFKLLDKAQASGWDQKSISQAQAYIDQIKKYEIPVYAGISGTLDQSTAMAGLVGLATSKNEDERKRQMETIKLAYLAFMLPGRDHSAHEILQSSKTYGLDYIAGPGYQNFIYGPDNQHITQRIREEQQKRGTDLPDYFLSKEYVLNVAQKMALENKETEKNLAEFKKRIEDSLQNSVVNPALQKKLNRSEHAKILNYFKDIKPGNNGQSDLDAIANLKPGQAYRIDKKDSKLPRTINIIRADSGEYKLIAETKSKLAGGQKAKTKVVGGAIKKGKSAWRLDTEQEYFNLVARFDKNDPKADHYIDEIRKESALSRKLGHRSEFINLTETSQAYESGKDKAIGVYSERALGTLDMVLDTLSPSERESLIAELIKVVKVMHDANIVHQDLKLQNILVYPGENGGYQLKLTDFGESREHDQENEWASAPHPYQSPELAYYYSNPHNDSSGYKDYKRKYYDGKKMIAKDFLKEAPDTYSNQVKNRNMYQQPNKANDMWALGMLVYTMRYGELPTDKASMADFSQDKLVSGLLDADRSTRYNINLATVAHNEQLESYRDKDIAPPTQQNVKENYFSTFIGIDINDFELGRALNSSFDPTKTNDYWWVDQSRQHITIGWFEDKDGIPTSPEINKKASSIVKAIIEQYPNLEFKIDGLEPSWTGNVHAALTETSGQLQAMREEIANELAPLGIKFKYIDPHVKMATLKSEKKPLSGNPEKDRTKARALTENNIKKLGAKTPMDEFSISKAKMQHYGKPRYGYGTKLLTDEVYSFKAPKSKLKNKT